MFSTKKSSIRVTTGVYCRSVWLQVTFDFSLGEKMTEDEVETLLAGHEDANGCINYEGKEMNKMYWTLTLVFW